MDRVPALRQSTGRTMTIPSRGQAGISAFLRATSRIMVDAGRFRGGGFGARIGFVLLIAGVSLAVVRSANPQPAENPVRRGVEDSVSAEEVAGQESEGRGAKDTEPPGSDVVLQERFIELRYELLEQRASSINLWLGVIGLVLTFFGIVIVIAGIWAFRRFREIEAEAKSSAEAAGGHEKEARTLLENIVQHKAESEKHLREIRGMTAEGAQEEPQQVSRAAAAVREDRGASSIEKAIGRAISLQQQGRTDDAVQLWRAVAAVAEGFDDGLAARAWFSSAYLKSVPNPREAIVDYGEAIRLNPENAGFFHNRGSAIVGLKQYEAAIADYSEAIRLNPENAAAFNARGTAKAALGMHETAIADFDEAIRLKPEDATAFHNRGLAQATLERPEAAAADHAEARRLSRDDG